MLQPQLNDEIEIIKDYGDVPPVYCSAGQLNQVFLSLLKNSSEAIDGTGEIAITTYTDQELLYLRFGDTGRGIAPERLERIFDFNFHAADSRVKMGFGLSTSYKIIQEHQGDIEIDSEVGQGTEVTISLPIKQTENP